MVGKVNLQYRCPDIDPREDYTAVNVGRRQMIKAHEVYRFDGILFSEKACRESEVRELEKNLDIANTEMFKYERKTNKHTNKICDLKAKLDMAIEVMKEVLEETGNRSLALYLAKLKDQEV